MLFLSPQRWNLQSYQTALGHTLNNGLVKCAESGCPIRVRHLDDVIENDVTDKRRQELERPLRYSHLEKSQHELVNKLLNGGISLDHVPSIRPRTVRMFVCSSGPDFEAERNYLYEHVYPLIRQYCRETHGVDFQLSDMYWGNPSMPSTDAETMDAVHEELKHCQKISMGPNFVSFIGQKYGPTRLPSSVPVKELDEIKTALEAEGKDTSLLDAWYQADLNIRPNLYRLQQPEKPDKSSKESYKRAVALLEEGAIECVKVNKISHSSAMKYICPDLEQLHMSGLFEIPKTQRNAKCLVYMRDITNIHEHLDAKNAKTFVDLTKKSCTWNISKKEKIESLKCDIEQALSKSNILKSTIALNGCALDESKSDEYIKGIARHFYATVTSLVDDEVRRLESLCEDNLCKVVVSNWDRVKAVSPAFCGREEILNSVKNYLMSETDQPLVIYGATGSGKTTTIAKAAADINEAIENSDLSMPTSIVTRFIGKDDQTETIQHLLYYLCHQLAFITGRYRQDVPSSYRSLKNYFIDLIQRGEYGGMLVILLDGLDKISSTDSGHKLDWLPSRIAANVKIVATVNSENVEMFERVQNKLEDGIIQMPEFTSIDCENIMKLLMNDSDRSVNYNQWKQIQNAFRNCSSPLFVNLVFEKVLKWKSNEFKDTHLGISADQIVRQVFDDVEQRFGKALVCKILGYLSASKTGLSESELEDILSLDDEALNNVFITLGCYPPARRFPQLCWILLRNALAPFLVSVEMDDIAVIQWKFKVFSQHASERYANTETDSCVRIHSNIADYFLGIWSGVKRKPFKHPAVLMAKYKFLETDDEACRFVPEQPFKFEQSNSYNLRKMSQLPYSLLCCKRYDELKAHVLCNYDYIFSKLRRSSVQSVLMDFCMFNDKETSLIADALRMSKSALEINPNSLGMELAGRLLPHMHKYCHLKNLIRQCDLDCQRSCPLVPNCQIYSSPGGPLQYECDVADGIKCAIDIDVFSSPDGVLLTAKPRHSQKLQVWELSEGDERPDIMLPVGDLYPTRNGKFMNIIVDNGCIKTFRSDCGVQFGEIYFGPGKIADIDVANKYLMFSIHKGAGPHIFDIERSEILHKFAYHTHAVAVSNEETFVAFNSERNILLYELPVIKRRCVAQVTDIASDIIFVDETPKCYILTQSKLIEAVQFDVINRKYYTKSVLTDLDARECIPSNRKKQLIVRCGKTLYLIDTVKDVVEDRFKKLPAGVFVDSSSTFSGAGFTPDDSMIVATRYTYLIVWDAKTYEPIRVLQSMVSPMVKLFTCTVINKVVTLLENNVFQVWNLENIDRDVLHSIEIHEHPVESLAVSSAASLILSHDLQTPDAKVISLENGKVMDTLQHSENSEDKIVAVELSPDGQFAVTRAKLVPTPRSSSATTFEVLTDDIMWEVETASKVFHAITNRYIVFSPTSKTAAFVTCAFYNPHDWCDNKYNVFIVHPETSSNYTIDFPYNTEFVGEPCITRKEKGDSLVAVVQTCKRTWDQGTEKEVSRWSEVCIFVQKLEETRSTSDQTILKLHNIVDTVNATDAFLAVKGLSDGNVLLIYAKDADSYSFETDKGIVKPRTVPKGAVIYDVDAGSAVKHIPSFLSPSSDVDKLYISKNSTIITDQRLHAFKLDTSKHTGQSGNDSQMLPESGRLALDGRYVIGISNDQLRIMIMRVSDSKELGYVFVHGRASCLEVADDDRTIVVGCHDGRIMILSLILEFSDPLREYIEKLPSRSGCVDEENLILNDVSHISHSTPDQHRLSARMRRRSITQERRPPTYTTLYRAVTISRQSSRSRGVNACVQQ